MIDFLHPALKLTKTVHKTTHTKQQKQAEDKRGAAAAVVVVVVGGGGEYGSSSWTYRINRYDAAV